jgi:hypothetical protein
MTRVERLLRWVWLVIGVLLLVLLVAGVVVVAVETIGARGGGSSDAVSEDLARGEHDQAEPMRYDPPEPIRGSSVRIVLLRRGTGYVYRSRASSAPASGEAPAVNVVFLDGEGGRLLLDRPAYIHRVAYPRSSVPASDSLRWIVYEMALRDTDRNGQVDESDRRSLYVTDLNGGGLRRVLPDGFELRDWAPQPGGALVATAVQIAPPGGGPMPQRAFVLDPDGRVRPDSALDSAVDAANRIYAKP